MVVNVSHKEILHLDILIHTVHILALTETIYVISKNMQYLSINHTSNIQTFAPGDGANQYIS